MKSTEPTALRILLVDDSPAFLHAATRALALDSRIDIVGKASSGHQAIALVPEVQPDVVLMDVAMPGMNGFEATRQIKSRPNPPRIVMLTSHDIAHYRTAAEDETQAMDSAIAGQLQGKREPPQPCPLDHGCAHGHRPEHLFGQQKRGTRGINFPVQRAQLADNEQEHRECH